MCGITGILERDPEVPADLRRLRELTRGLAHRGPDDAGFFLRGPVGLGMRRLAINDVARGRQPHANETCTVRVVANGEIYNAPELRAGLEARGHRLRSASDTEVIPHLYEEEGPDFVARLHGMFAIALWDETNRRLLLARDRFGMKPLYYAETESSLLFASEMGPLLADPDLPVRIDREGFARYLLWEYVPSPQTVVEGIRKLPPAHIATVDRNGLRVRRYWTMPEPRPPGRPPSPGDAEILRARLDRAVRRHLLSDVPVGLFLSGGIDSTTIAACLRRIGAGPIRSFSIGFEERSYDESRYARLAAERLGTEHHEAVYTAGEALDDTERLGDLLDEPLADPSILPTHRLARLARAHVKVALGGDGADELFAGYPTCRAEVWAGRYRRLPTAIRRIVARTATALPVSHRNLSFEFRLKRFLRGAEEPDAASRLIAWMSPLSTLPGEPLLEGPPPATAFPDGSAVDLPGRLGPLDTALRLNLQTYLPEDILAKVDRASMACGLEVRVPFLDTPLAEHILRMPHDWKLRGRRTKWILRKGMGGEIPAPIRRRGKKGFGIPVSRWIAGPLRMLVEDLLAPRRLKEQGLVRPAAVQRLLTEQFARRADHRKAIWSLLVFELWWDAKVAGARRARHRAEPVRAG